MLFVFGEAAEIRSQIIQSRRRSISYELSKISQPGLSTKQTEREREREREREKEIETRIVKRIGYAIPTPSEYRNRVFSEREGGA